MAVYICFIDVIKLIPRMFPIAGIFFFTRIPKAYDFELPSNVVRVTWILIWNSVIDVTSMNIYRVTNVMLIVKNFDVCVQRSELLGESKLSYVLQLTWRSGSVVDCNRTVCKLKVGDLCRIHSCNSWLRYKHISQSNFVLMSCLCQWTWWNYFILWYFF